MLRRRLAALYILLLHDCDNLAERMLRHAGNAAHGNTSLVITNGKIYARVQKKKKFWVAWDRGGGVGTGKRVCDTDQGMFEYVGDQDEPC